MGKAERRRVKRHYLIVRCPSGGKERADRKGGEPKKPDDGEKEGLDENGPQMRASKRFLGLEEEGMRKSGHGWWSPFVVVVKLGFAIASII